MKRRRNKRTSENSSENVLPPKRKKSISRVHKICLYLYIEYYIHHVIEVTQIRNRCLYSPSELA